MRADWSDEGDDVPPDRAATPIEGYDEVGGFEDLEDWYEPDTVAEVDRWGERNSVLHAGDDSHVAEAPPFASRLNTWSRRTAIGAVMQGMAMGLQEIFEPKEQAPIVVEVDDDGLPTDLPVQLLLDPDDPSGSLALVHRPGVKPPEV